MVQLIFNAIRNFKINLPNVHVDALVKFLGVISFTVPIYILYLLYPESYDRTFKGRLYYIFFLWLTFLELALRWKNIRVKANKLLSARFIAFSTALTLPTLYVLVANFLGLNTIIVEISPKHYGLDSWAKFMPLAIEYLVFAMLSLLITALAYGVEDLRVFSLPTALIGIVGLTFLIDNLYPYGEFTLFQVFVPTTANLATMFLSFAGYQTEWIGQIYKTPVLKVWNERGEASIGIAWPCSGIDSLVIYSVTIILFLEESNLSRKQKIVYFIIGAVVTYFVNILRIVSIFTIAIEYGVASLEVQRFHDYYGPLYSMTWIIMYQLIIVGSRVLWRKILSRTLS